MVENNGQVKYSDKTHWDVYLRIGTVIRLLENKKTDESLDEFINHIMDFFEENTKEE